MTDLALVNANVLTMDPNRPRATAVAIAQGRITALDEIPAGAARVVDLRGATVLPGFHDAHNHMIGFGMSLGEVDIGSPPVGSLDELYAAIARRAETTAPGEWVIGSGYNQNKLGGHHPDRDALDRAAPGRRVWLRHTSGHMCVVNSLVLADLGIDTAATELPGGRVATDSGGRPTGLLEERAQLLVGSLVYPYPLAELTGAIARAAGQYLKEGVTSCTEAGIGGGWVAHSPAELAAYAAARDQGQLGVRVELMTAGEVLHPLGAHADDNLVAGLDLGISTGFGDDWLRLGAVKIFADGSLVGRTAALHDPYYHCDTAGVPAGRRGRPARRDHRRAPLRLAGRHARDRRPGHRPGARRLRRRPGAVPAARPQAPHRALRRGPAPAGRPGRGARRDRGAAGPLRHRARRRHARRGRPDRTAWLYRQRSLLEAGMVLPGSSDRPVVAGAPLLGIDGMVNRRTSSGAPFNPDEAVTAEQALRAWTRGSAYASRQEHVKGSIAPGMLADLVVLSEDPAAVSPDRIADLEVLATIVGGQFGYTSLD